MTVEHLIRGNSVIATETRSPYFPSRLLLILDSFRFVTLAEHCLFSSTIQAVSPLDSDRIYSLRRAADAATKETAAPLLFGSYIDKAPRQAAGNNFCSYGIHSGEVSMRSSHHADHVWALVLAGGDGNRLRSLTTTDEGQAIPKQYCSLHGQQTLLENALVRAHSIAAKQRVCTVVAAQHREWWQPQLGEYAVEHIVQQPRNCGTAIGIMLPLLHILREDPQARIVMLPSDHHVQDEATLSEALARAAERLDSNGSDKLIILGVEPEQPDTELGYVLPGKHLGHGVATVSHFVEKPPLIRAHQLLAQGALWNTFIVAAKATTLVQLLKQRCSGIFEEMQSITDQSHTAKLRQLLLDELYTRLPTLDFSRDILQGYESFLEVLAVAACGWSDLGTPRRIREVLHRWPPPQKSGSASSRPAPFSLADHAGFLLSKSMHESRYSRDA